MQESDGLRAEIKALNAKLAAAQVSTRIKLFLMFKYNFSDFVVVYSTFFLLLCSSNAIVSTHLYLCYRIAFKLLRSCE
jgi:hypothetical protein